MLDEWFEAEVRPRLSGDCTLVRFADDALLAFGNVADTQRVLAVLGKRLARFGLTLDPDKTRLVDFRPQRTEETPPGYGGNYVRLPWPHPCLGTDMEGVGHGSANHCQKPLCSCGVCCDGLVSEESASAASRAAHPSAVYATGPLRLLRRRW